MNRDHPAFADWDAAYVLGALTPADRRTFEEHLLSCELCRVAVAELAPLPGLLARAAAPESDLPDPYAHVVSPRADLADLVARRADRERRTSRVRRGLAAVAVAAAMVLAVVLVVPRGGEAPGPTAAPDATVTLVQAADVPLTANVRLTSVAWGTRIAMECDYPAGSPQDTGTVPRGRRLVRAGRHGLGGDVEPGLHVDRGPRADGAPRRRDGGAAGGDRLGGGPVGPDRPAAAVRRRRVSRG